MRSALRIIAAAVAIAIVAAACAGPPAQTAPPDPTATSSAPALVVTFVPSAGVAASRRPQGYALPAECQYIDGGTVDGSATTWRISCPQGLPSNYLRSSLTAQSWVSCGTKVWQKNGLQIAIIDAVNVSGFTGWLDERPSSGTGCVQPTPPPAAVASPSSSGQADVPLPGADRFALVVHKGCSPPGPPPYVRREDRSEVIAPLGNGYLCQLHGAVSPDGRRLAYWLDEIGRSEIAIYQGGSSSTVVRLGDELLGNLVWSSDATGLLFVAMKGGVQGVPPEYAALRTLDVATGSIQELTRVTGRFLGALAWDRTRRMTAATSAASARAVEYLVITEDRVTRSILLSAEDIVAVTGSPDAAFISGFWRTENVIRYWPMTSFEDRKELRPPPGLDAGLPTWRPGTRELAVVVSGGGTQTLELWSLDGSRRRVAGVSGQSGGLFFRPDGSAIFIGGGSGVDVATGRVVHFALGQGERLAASLLH